MRQPWVDASKRHGGMLPLAPAAVAFEVSGPAAALAQGKEDLAREALSRKAAAQAQIDDMESQRQQLAEEQEKLEHTLAALQQRVNTFRTQKEVLKAQYTAAKAQSDIGATAAGIS